MTGLSKLFAFIAASVLALPAAAQTIDDAAVKVQDFAVFVDPPAGFVFAKMPVGREFFCQAVWITPRSS